MQTKLKSVSCLALASVAQLVGALSHEPEGCGFNPQSGHMPMLWVQSTIRTCLGHNQLKFPLHCCFPSSVSMYFWVRIKKKYLVLTDTPWRTKNGNIVPVCKTTTRFSKQIISPYNKWKYQPIFLLELHWWIDYSHRLTTDIRIQQKTKICLCDNQFTIWNLQEFIYFISLYKLLAIYPLYL